MTADIIIVTYGQPDIETRCVESVKKYTDLNKHGLVVVDNFVRDKNLGALWNELIEKCDRDFICLLNSDTVVEPEWLEKLIACAIECEADAVGPMTNHCGIGHQVGPRGSFYREVSQLSGFCMLMRRSSWLRANGFREDAPFYGQESNLLRRLRHKVLCGRVFVHHEAGASVKASQRAEEERALSRYWWPKNTEFNWKNRLAILGSPTSPFPLWVGINQAVKEFGREGMAAKHFDVTTVTANELREFNPTVVIVVSQRWDRCALSATLLQPFKVPRACWFNDLRPGDYADRLHGFDRVFLCFKNAPAYSWDMWRKRSNALISYMPQGSVISTELAPLKIERNLIFIGGKYNQQRRDAVHHLQAFVLNEDKREKRMEVEKQSQLLYRQSRYVLSISANVPGYTSIRLYNIMAYGGLALTSRFSGVEQMFTHGKHMLIWKTLDHAVDLMNTWRRNEIECEVMRKRAWRLQQAKHTVSSRLMNMVANLTTTDQTFWGEGN